MVVTCCYKVFANHGPRIRRLQNPYERMVPESDADFGRRLSSPTSAVSEFNPRKFRPFGGLPAFPGCQDSVWPQHATAIESKPPSRVFENSTTRVADVAVMLCFRMDTCPSACHGHSSLCQLSTSSPLHLSPSSYHFLSYTVKR